MSTILQRNVEAKLAALEGPEWDSSDDDDQNIVSKQTTTTTLTLATTKGKASIKTNTKKAKLLQRLTIPMIAKENNASRVIYLGHIPKGFEEAELSAFLGQFGQVTQLQLSRSKKTANSRGYAFVEFVSRDVAAIVADTLSGYLIDSKRMVCHVLPKDKVRKEMFSGRPFKRIDWTARHRSKVNAPKSNGKMNMITKRLLQRELVKRTKLLELGIDYDFPGYAASSNAFPSKEVKEPPPTNNQDKISKDINTQKKELKTIKTNKRKAEELPKEEDKNSINTGLENKAIAKAPISETKPVKRMETDPSHKTDTKSNKKAKTKSQVGMKQKSVLAQPTELDKSPVKSKLIAPSKTDKKKKKSPAIKLPGVKKDTTLTTPVSAKSPSSTKTTASTNTPTGEKSPALAKTPTAAKVSMAPPIVRTSSKVKSPTTEKIPTEKKMPIGEKVPTAGKSRTKGKSPAEGKAPVTPTSEKTSVTPVSGKAPAAAKIPDTLIPITKKEQVPTEATKRTPPPKTPVTKKVTIVASPASEAPIKKVTPAQTRSRGKTPVKESQGIKRTPSAQKALKSAKDFTPPTTRSKMVAPKTEVKAVTKKKSKATRRGSN